MGRHKQPKDDTPKFCVICGDIAKGVNFNALTCMSCKELICPFKDSCTIDQITRKFCTKCRLKKCIQAGMKKEWILNEAEKQLIKAKKMTKHVIRRQKEQEQQQQQQQRISESSFDSNDGFFSLDNTEETNLALETMETGTSWNSFDSLDQLFSFDLNSSELLTTTTTPDGSNLFPDLLKFSENDDNCLSFADSSAVLDEAMQFESTNISALAQPLSPANHILESLRAPPSPSTSPPLILELGLPSRELIGPERCLIRELAEACSVLQNPYKRIIDTNNDDYYKGTTNSFHIFRTQYHFHRMIRMSKRLTSFRRLPITDQVLMLKSTLVEMLNIQSILMYNSDRQSWRFIDDRCKSSVMVRQDLIKPFCANFELHRNMPKKFRDEWKRDNIIFDLLTAIILFNPQPEYTEYDRIKEEHLRYTSLLRRYLEMKYPTLTEATECFNQLMSNITESRQLVFDLKNNGGQNEASTTSLMAIESSEIAEEVSNFELDLDSFDMF